MDLAQHLTEMRALVRNFPESPGVYRMLSETHEILYVGKARSLKKRVASYFRTGEGGHRKEGLIAAIRDIQFTVTHTETEALLLEHSLIKEHQPRYNVLLRDDKSYPYIYLSDSDMFPRLSLHRGARKARGRYFGPYPSAFAVRESLSLLQKLFRVRQCEDSFYRNRTRPCLQYQIKRCSGPCVGLVDAPTYRQDVMRTVWFLEGKSQELIRELGERMDNAAKNLEYERAAVIRDQIKHLNHVQERQYVTGESGDLDVIAAAMESGMACVQVFFIRSGRNLGSKIFYPRLAVSTEPGELRAAFITQFYAEKQPPAEVLVDREPEEADLLADVLSQRANRRVRLTWKLRGERRRWLTLAGRNAEVALKTRLATRSGLQERLEALQQALNLPEVPNLINCFDVSHTQGERTVASCVSFTQEGIAKGLYRKFNIDGIEPGDDYAAMRQALSRHFTRLKQGQGMIPDLLLIDGGKGQLRIAEEVLRELQVEEVQIVGVAKGPSRKPGMEQLFLSGTGAPHILPADSPALHLIQQIRDEAHRFAITGHRGRRAKARTSSSLEDIPNVGPKRRQALLRHFGGLAGVTRAGIEDLAKVEGISRVLAEEIYAVFHPE